MGDTFSRSHGLPKTEAAAYRALAGTLPAGSGLRAALLASARQIETGDTSPVTLQVAP